ncbi:unnamed protein product [Anisakis simplex]|uniref:CE295 protein n=1 Tax=Anisakis simplex TaxID=6269 RepID=A0A0M3K8N7_ANISI|nr:unnamed protein product [Anisakis simplex]
MHHSLEAMNDDHTKVSSEENLKLSEPEQPTEMILEDHSTASNNESEFEHVSVQQLVREHERRLKCIEETATVRSQPLKKHQADTSKTPLISRVEQEQSRSDGVTNMNDGVCAAGEEELKPERNDDIEYEAESSEIEHNQNGTSYQPESGDQQSETSPRFPVKYLIELKEKQIREMMMLDECKYRQIHRSKSHSEQSSGTSYSSEVGGSILLFLN